jgi:predicted nucleic acid-binding protein
VILVDTNVWIYSMGSRHPDLPEKVAELVETGDVLGHDLVYLELLLGQGGRVRNAVVERYRDLEQAPVLPNGEVATFIKQHRLAARGIGVVDVALLASVHAGRHALWTEDPALKKAAAALGVRLRAGPVASHAGLHSGVTGISCL